VSQDFPPPPRTSEPLFLVPWPVPAFAGLFLAIHAAVTYAPIAWKAWAYTSLSLVPAMFLTDDPARTALSVADLLTYGFLHIDWIHVAVNCALLMAACGPVYRNCGGIGMVLLFSLCTIAGGLAHLVVHWGEANPVIGASAGAAGLIGAALRYRARRLSQGEIVAPINRPPVLTFTYLWIGMNAAFFLWDKLGGGVVTGFASIAHIGGYVAGLFLAGILVKGARPRPWPPKP
jgi:membrane associated rhomboid family serine protease